MHLNLIYLHLWKLFLPLNSQIYLFIYYFVIILVFNFETISYQFIYLFHFVNLHLNTLLLLFFHFFNQYLCWIQNKNDFHLFVNSQYLVFFLNFWQILNIFQEIQMVTNPSEYKILHHLRLIKRPCFIYA